MIDAPYDWAAPPEPSKKADPTWLEMGRPNTHPLWHICQKCMTFLKLAVFFICADIAGEFITFVPIHRFFEYLGWI